MQRLLKLSLALVLSASPMLAQQQQGKASVRNGEYKDPGTATVIGVVVVGGGQMYAGETGRGLALLAIGLGGLLAGEVMTASSCASVTATCNVAPFAIGAAAYLGTWIYGMVDAGAAARRHNAASGLSDGSRRVSPVVRVGAGQTEFGVNIGLR